MGERAAERRRRARKVGRAAAARRTRQTSQPFRVTGWSSSTSPTRAQSSPGSGGCSGPSTVRLPADARWMLTVPRRDGPMPSSGSEITASGSATTRPANRGDLDAGTHAGAVEVGGASRGEQADEPARAAGERLTCAVAGSGCRTRRGHRRSRTTALRRAARPRRTRRRRQPTARRRARAAVRSRRCGGADGST